MPRIIVGPKYLRDCASDFKTIGGKIDALTNDMRSLVNALATDWEGQASNEFRNKFKSLEKEFSDRNDSLAKYINHLNESANKYEKAEADATIK